MSSLVEDGGVGVLGFGIWVQRLGVGDGDGDGRLGGEGYLNAILIIKLYSNKYFSWASYKNKNLST